MIRGQARRQHDCVCACERRQWLAQAPRGQHPVVEVALCHQYNVEVASQRTVLKAVVEDVQSRLEFPLSDSTRGIAAFTDDHRDAQPPRDQQRLIAEFRGVTGGFDNEDAATFAAVSAREHVEPNTAPFQQFTKRNHKRSLARAADRQISDADHRLLQSPGRQHTAIEQRVSQSGGGGVEPGERIHAEPSPECRPIIVSVPIRWSSAEMVLPVAPRWDSNAARAFRPSVVRSPPFSISSMKTRGSSARPTMRTALRLAKKLTTSRKFS